MKTIFLIISIWSASRCLLLSQVPRVDDLLDPAWAKVGYYRTNLEVVKIDGSEPGEEFKVQLEWAERSDGCFLTRLIHSQFKQVLDITESYDGSRYGLLDRGTPTSMYKTSGTLPRDVKSFVSGICPFQPFRFLIKTAAGDQLGHPHLRDIVGKNSLEAVLKPLGEMTYADTPALAFETDGGQAIASGEAIRYRVYKSAESRELLGWQCVTTDDKILSDLKIERWSLTRLEKEGVSLRYPSAYTMRFFANGSSKGIPSFSYLISLGAVTISDRADIDEFSIDPSEADFAYDLDEKVFIQIPK